MLVIVLFIIKPIDHLSLIHISDKLNITKDMDNTENHHIKISH